MASTTVALLMIVGLSANVVVTVEANGFLKANPVLAQERLSEEEVQMSLLAEVEGALGEGTAGSRVKQLEGVLAPIYAALPKNEKGYLGHATVRYALHRLFVQRHGWVIKGLDTAGAHRNTTSTAGLLKEQVPAYVQDLFEKRLGNRGFGLHELGVLAATIEHLIHNEAVKRVGDTFKVHNLLPTSPVNESLADEILDTYMTAYILGEDLSKLTLEHATILKAEMPAVYLAWNATQGFVRGVRGDVVASDASAVQKASGDLDFSLVARTAERVSEQFGRFQHTDCETMKGSLMKMEEKGTGRVRLSDFYKPALDGDWQFQESTAYLRQLGALDETDPERPRVIIANYVNSPANCIASSNFYSVCCMDECEGLLGHLEQKIAAPEASPSRIAALVADLSSSTVAAPRTLPPVLLDRLGEIAATHGGTVPLHGRLFAQWMHHAFPRECNYPHAHGTTNAQSPDEWLEGSGQEAQADEKEMRGHVDKADALKASTTEEEEIAELPWAPEEELLVVRAPVVEQVGGGSMLAMFRSAALFMAMVSVAYALVRSSLRSSSDKGYALTEKLMV